MSTEEKQLPIERIKCGAITAAIWRKDGQNGPWYQVDAQRCYKGQDEKFHYTTTFSRDELPVVSKLLDAAFARILRLEAKDRENDTDGRPGKVKPKRQASPAAATETEP